METGEKNVHALNLYEAQNTTLENVTLDHTNAYKGAPLVVNSSTAAVKGSFKTITGAKSWYAINLDKKTSVDPSIDFTQATSVTFDKAEGTTAKYPLYTELTEKAPELVVGADKAGITISSNGLFIPSEIPVSTVDELKTAMLLENANIILNNDIELTSNLMIPAEVSGTTTPAKNITINGNGHKIFADEEFVKQEDSKNANLNNLVTVVGENVTLKNITLQTGPNNKNALNLYKAKGVVLDNVVLDNQASFAGAPLIVGSSDVTVQNGLKAIAGPNSWYAINLDNNYGNASINFKDKTFTFVNNSGKDLPVIGVDDHKNNNKNDVVNPENANLTVGENNTYVCNHSQTEIRNNKDATPDAEGYTGDTYCSICGKLLSKGTVVAKVDEHPEIGEAIANGTWGKDEATATPKPATSAAGSTATVTTTNNSIPQTADEMNIGLLMMLLVVSAAGLTGTVLYTRKNKAK